MSNHAARCPSCGTSAAVVQVTKSQTRWLFRASWTLGKWVDTGLSFSTPLAKVRRFFEWSKCGMYLVVERV